MSTPSNTCTTCKKSLISGPCILNNGKLFCDVSCYNHYKAIIKPSILPNNKSCIYCFASYDTNIHPGIQHGSLWFCSHDHLILANPRTHIMGGYHPHVHAHIHAHIHAHAYIHGLPLIPTAHMAVGYGVLYPNVVFYS